MLKRTLYIRGLLVFLLMPTVGHITGVQTHEFTICQTQQKITVDGKLDEWAQVPETLVNLNLAGEEIQASPDIGVTARFTFDSKFFYAAVVVRDDIFEFPSRGWRYGDGMMLTFFEPNENAESDRFYSFGFSIEEKEPQKYLVNRDGEFFPGAPLGDVEIAIETNIPERTVIYELAIPFTDLQPFKPFIHKMWGINLIYADRDREEREVLQIFPDRNYDTEHSAKRKGAIFQFVSHVPEKPEVQATMNASHYYHDAEKTLTFAIHSPTGGEWTLLYNLSSENKSFTEKEKHNVQSGMNIINFTLEEGNYSSGQYDLSVGAIDENGRLRFTQDNTFFIINRSELAEYEVRIAEAFTNGDYSDDETYINSLPTAEIRIEWIKAFMQDAPPFASMGTIHQHYVDLEFLWEELEEGKPALFLPGRVGRLAHRSKIDGTLQPYSLYVPDFYIANPEGAKKKKADKEKEDKKDSEEKDKEDKEQKGKEKKEIQIKDFPALGIKGESLGLFVTLHGSGVDEKRFILGVAQTHLDFRFRNRVDRMLVLAPKARGKSDFYLGDSAQDVLECIEHVKKLYNVDPRRVVLDGFSMGGYGAWRLGLLYPKIFKAVVVRSGAIAPPPRLEGENILDLLEAGERNRFFVVHGDQDNAVSVDNARQAVKKMEELGMKYKYEEVEGAAHGGYDKWEDIFDWIRDILPRAPGRNEPPMKRKR